MDILRTGPTQPISVHADGTVGASHYDGFTFAFERDFDVYPTTHLLRTYYWTLTLASVGGYLLAILVGRRFMRDRPAYDLTNALQCWNWFLAIFSILGAWRHLTELFHVLHMYGMHGSICTSSIADSLAAYWAEKFAISKLVEYGDTAFLVLRKRPITFLHWYHHATVLAYTWHGVKDLTIPGRWFITMNYTVHAVMYTYYALCSGGKRFPRWLSACITTMQLAQMFVGCAVSYYSFSILYKGGECLQKWENVQMGAAMYASYALLFAHYFYVNYFGTRTKDMKKKVVSSAVKNGAVANNHTANGHSKAHDD